MSELTMLKKYEMALKQLQDYSDNEFIIIEGNELNIADELKEVTAELYSTDTDRLKIVLGRLLSKWKPEAVIKLWSQEDWHNGIRNGVETDTIIDMKADGTYQVWNNTDKGCLAYEETFHFQDIPEARILKDMISSVEKFGQDYFRQSDEA